jgi:hypothetical protein
MHQTMESRTRHAANLTEKMQYAHWGDHVAPQPDIMHTGHGASRMRALSLPGLLSTQLPVAIWALAGSAGAGTVCKWIPNSKRKSSPSPVQAATHKAAPGLLSKLHWYVC